MPEAILKSDMESIAYMMGFKKAMQKSTLDLGKKCEYLERKCKQALLDMTFHLFMILRLRDHNVPQEVVQLMHEVVSGLA